MHWMTRQVVNHNLSSKPIFLQASDGAQSSDQADIDATLMESPPSDKEGRPAHSGVIWSFCCFLSPSRLIIGGKNLVQRWKVVQQSVVSGWQSQGFGSDCR